jgi:hypothetical protein
MKSIELTILKEDIQNYSYSKPQICPITQALKRAGFTAWRDVADGFSKGYYMSDRKNILITENKNYDEMVKRIIGAQIFEGKFINFINEEYKKPYEGYIKEPETFTITINLPEDIEP